MTLPIEHHPERPGFLSQMEFMGGASYRRRTFALHAAGTFPPLPWTNLSSPFSCDLGKPLPDSVGHGGNRCRSVVWLFEQR